MMLTIFFWIVTLLPSSFWFLLIFLGAGIIFAAGILSRLHSLRAYAILIKPIGLVVAALGVFMYGGYGINQHYVELIKEYKEKIKVAEEASREVNTVIQTEIVTQREVIRDRQIEYRDRIIEIAEQIDSKCVIEPEVVSLHNKAASNPFVIEPQPPVPKVKK
jgi:hypothetical protein